MDDIEEVKSSSSSDTEEEISANFNETLTEADSSDQKILSTQQVFELMADEVKKICEVTSVSE